MSYGRKSTLKRLAKEVKTMGNWQLPDGKTACTHHEYVVAWRDLGKKTLCALELEGARVVAFDPDLLIAREGRPALELPVDLALKICRLKDKKDALLRALSDFIRTEPRTRLIRCMYCNARFDVGERELPVYCVECGVKLTIHVTQDTELRELARVAYEKGFEIRGSLLPNGEVGWNVPLGQTMFGNPAVPELTKRQTTDMTISERIARGRGIQLSGKNRSQDVGCCWVVTHHE